MGSSEIRPQIERASEPGRNARASRRYARILIALVAVSLVVITLVRDQGVIGTWKLSRTERQLKAENERLRNENARLLGEVHKLRTSSEIIEKRAREMGLVYPGELVIDTRGDNAARQAAPEPGARSLPKGGPGRP
jgi:cell division protein FtsB